MTKELSHTRTNISRFLLFLTSMLDLARTSGARSDKAGISHIIKQNSNCTLNKGIQNGIGDDTQFDAAGRAIHRTLALGSARRVLPYNGYPLKYECDDSLINCVFEPGDRGAYANCQLKDFHMDPLPFFQPLSFEFFLKFFDPSFTNFLYRGSIPFDAVGGNFIDSIIGSETGQVNINNIEDVYYNLVKKIQESYSRVFDQDGNIRDEALHAELQKELKILGEISRIETVIENSHFTGTGKIINAFLKRTNQLGEGILFYNLQRENGATITDSEGNNLLVEERDVPPNLPQNSPPKKALEYVREHNKLHYNLVFSADIPSAMREEILDAVKALRQFGIILDTNPDGREPYGNINIDFQNLPSYVNAKVEEIAFLPNEGTISFNSNWHYKDTIDLFFHELVHVMFGGRHYHVGMGKMEKSSIDTKSALNSLSKDNFWLFGDKIGIFSYARTIKLATTNLGPDEITFLQGLAETLGVSRNTSRTDTFKLYDTNRIVYVDGTDTQLYLEQAPKSDALSFKLKIIDPQRTITCNPITNCGPIDMKGAEIFELEVLGGPMTKNYFIAARTNVKNIQVKAKDLYGNEYEFTLDLERQRATPPPGTEVPTTPPVAPKTTPTPPPGTEVPLRTPETTPPPGTEDPAQPPPGTTPQPGNKILIIATGIFAGIAVLVTAGTYYYIKHRNQRQGRDSTEMVKVPGTQPVAMETYSSTTAQPWEQRIGGQPAPAGLGFFNA